jgi:surface polysaccharide O-acyltransferase-like enzyme
VLKDSKRGNNMNFKPTKYKIIISLLFTLGWYFFLFYTNLKYSPCVCVKDGLENCIDYNYLSPLRGGCHCGCVSILQIIKLYFVIFIIPFLIIYIITSLVEKKNAKQWKKVDKIKSQSF